jgi:hypothetical protein
MARLDGVQHPHDAVDRVFVSLESAIRQARSFNAYG